MTKELSNQKVSAEFRNLSGDRPYIFLIDKTDHYNGSSAFTTNIRGIAKAWTFLEHIFTVYELQEDVDFYGLIKILNDKFNLKTHSYCAID